MGLADLSRALEILQRRVLEATQVDQEAQHTDTRKKPANVSCASCLLSIQLLNQRGACFTDSRWLMQCVGMGAPFFISTCTEQTEAQHTRASAV